MENKQLVKNQANTTKKTPQPT